MKRRPASDSTDSENIVTFTHLNSELTENEFEIPAKWRREDALPQYKHLVTILIQKMNNFKEEHLLMIQLHHIKIKSKNIIHLINQLH